MSAFDEFLAEISKPQGNDPFAGSQGETPVEDSQSSKTEANTSAEGASSSDDNQTETAVPFHKNPRWQKMVGRNQKLEGEVERLAGLVEKLEKQPTPSASFDEGDTPIEWLSVHGDNENSRKAWMYQERLLEKLKAEAKDELRQELAQQEQESQKETEHWQQYIDDQLETLEEKYGVDLTSETPAAKKARTEFLGLVQRLSPKDEGGNVTSFADFDATWDYYKSKKDTAKGDSTTARKQELASRSMSRSNEAPTADDSYTAGEGFAGVRDRLGL